MIKGFRDFILRGNVVDLAVAVVVGGAFTALVGAFTQAFIDPILTRIGGAEVGTGWGIQLGDEGNEATFINIGAMLTAITTFLITAAVVYFLFVLPMNTFRELRAAGAEPEPPAPPEDVLLLQEIRDLLRTQQGRPPVSPNPASNPDMPT